MQITIDEKGNCVYRSQELLGSKIQFKGKNNVLYVEDDVKLADSMISFNGNNSIVYIGGGDTQSK